MIAYLEGTITTHAPSHLIVDCGGVGYRVNISLNAYESFRGIRQARVPVYFQVTDTAHMLFGFRDLRERALFEQLIGISGVGGQTALTILSSLTPEELEEAIESEDLGALTCVKGVGQKTAGRIVLELRGKLPKLAGKAHPDAGPSPANIRTEAVDALVSLGFDKPAMEKKIDALLKQSNPPEGVEALIKAALKN